MISELTRNHFIAKKQGKYCRDLKETLKPNECLLQGDYSQNYSMTISVNSFLKPVLQHIKIISPSIDTIKYFTDGAAGQYKNCKNFVNLLRPEEDFNIKYAEWNFFATSHGKGPCDGIWDTIKRLAYRHSLQGGDIQTPLALCQWVAQQIENLKMFFVSSEDVTENQKRLEGRLCEARTLPGTQSFHRFVPSLTSKYHMDATDISENGNLMGGDCTIVLDLLFVELAWIDPFSLLLSPFLMLREINDKLMLEIKSPRGIDVLETI